MKKIVIILITVTSQSILASRASKLPMQSARPVIAAKIKTNPATAAAKPVAKIPAPCQQVVETDPLAYAFQFEQFAAQAKQLAPKKQDAQFVQASIKLSNEILGVIKTTPFNELEQSQSLEQALHVTQTNAANANAQAVALKKAQLLIAQAQKVAALFHAIYKEQAAELAKTTAKSNSEAKKAASNPPQKLAAEKVDEKSAAEKPNATDKISAAAQQPLTQAEVDKQNSELVTKTINAVASLRKALPYMTPLQQLKYTIVGSLYNALRQNLPSEMLMKNSALNDLDFHAQHPLEIIKVINDYILSTKFDSAEKYEKLKNILKAVEQMEKAIQESRGSLFD